MQCAFLPNLTSGLEENSYILPVDVKKMFDVVTVHPSTQVCFLTPSKADVLIFVIFQKKSSILHQDTSVCKPKLEKLIPILVLSYFCKIDIPYSTQI